jgi:hypothetical protein
MSYCSLPRLVFSGQFQADVSTVNNDVRHFDNAGFRPRYQTPQGPAPDDPTQTQANGWWNPDGTGAFRLTGVTVKRALLEPNTNGDPAEGLVLSGQIERSAAKLVDLDPQFQMGSMIFGLRVALIRDDVEYMRGTYRPTAFRDIYFGRAAPPARGSGGASAKFTSVLTDVSWGPRSGDSPVLAALKTASEENENTLAINLVTYGYVTRSPFLGFVAGSIGTWQVGEPKSFIAGRRFAVAGTDGAAATPSGIGYFDAEVGEHVALDLGNALPLDGSARQLRNIGALLAGVLKVPDEGPLVRDGRPSVAAAISEGDVIAEDQFVALGAVPYTPAWLAETAGIVDFAIPDQAEGIIQDHPLALLQPTSQPGLYRVLIREAIAGLFLRVDDFEARMDPPPDGLTAAQRQLYARQWGKPAPNLPIAVGLTPKQSGGGGGFGANQPSAPIPDINFPSYAVRLQAPRTTFANGTAVLAIQASDPGNPRGYIDGQIYQFAYDFDVDGVSPKPQLDLIVLHVRDAVEVPEHPDWVRDIGPFMQQYDNLYPIMSRDLFSLSDPAVAEQHAKLLAFAFERPIDDPNHMPATRDLSEGKRRTILRWLAQFIPGHVVPPLDQPRVAKGDEIAQPLRAARLTTLSAEALKGAIAALGDATDGKTQAMRDFLQSQLDA